MDADVSLRLNLQHSRPTLGQIQRRKLPHGTFFLGTLPWAGETKRDALDDANPGRKRLKAQENVRQIRLRSGPAEGADHKGRLN